MRSIGVGLRRLHRLAGLYRQKNDADADIIAIAGGGCKHRVMEAMLGGSEPLPFNILVTDEGVVQHLRKVVGDLN